MEQEIPRNAMRVGWIGFHVEGLMALRALVECGVTIEGVVTLGQEAAAQRSGSGSTQYRTLCERFGLRLHEVESINDADSIELLRMLDLDLAFVIGWTELLRPSVLSLARAGMIGAHASLLPRNRGRAPINWALIRGERYTGNTLFWLTAGVDAGDVIEQAPIPITPYDTCASLYRRIAEANRDMILRAMPALLAGQRPGRPQGAPSGPPLPRRRPEDGLVDWTRSSDEIYDLVRALTRPYPGAFTGAGDDRLTIWRCARLPAAAIGAGARPGEVLGPVVSPAEQACGQLVACGRGAIVLLEVARADGAIMRGRVLSDLDWTGRVLGATCTTPHGAGAFESATPAVQHPTYPQ
jgi:methionyl-tRNA formyltransferase